MPGWCADRLRKSHGGFPSAPTLASINARRSARSRSESDVRRYTESPKHGREAARWQRGGEEGQGKVGGERQGRRDERSGPGRLDPSHTPAGDADGGQDPAEVGGTVVEGVVQVHEVAGRQAGEGPQRAEGG